MAIELQRHTAVSVGRSGSFRRRDFLRGVAAAGVAASTVSWRQMMAAESEQVRKKGRACILLWMNGAPSQFESFDPKPGHANNGETKVISTAVPGIQVADNFPKIAEQMKEISIIRSMTTKEGAHPRGQYLLHTGYIPTASVKYPAFGSVVAQQLGKPELELPAFVRIAGGRDSTGGGILGVGCDPFVMQDPERLPPNVDLTTDAARYARRLSLLRSFENSYATSRTKHEIEEHGKVYRKAATMIQSTQMKAFDLEGEPQSIQDGYGYGPFGSGCLLARRLVEAGVPFVEVALNGWDTHDDNFRKTRDLAVQVDQPWAFLLKDLKDRGLLDTTLVVWMGEFGRTPKINPRAGRDHFPNAFNVALAGGGIVGGRVVGKTNEGGTAVAERPVTVPDLFQTFCKSLEINPGIENYTSTGRPIKIVEQGEPVKELFA